MTLAVSPGFSSSRRAGVLAVLVAEGQVVEQVFGGLDAFGGEHLRDARTDAAHIHDWSVEAGHNRMLQPRGTQGERFAAECGRARLFAAVES